MLPCGMAKYILHCDTIDATLSGKSRNAYSAFGKALSSVNYLMISEFGVMGFCPNRLAFLGYFIRYVISVCAKKEMARINAWWVVALVADVQSIMNWAMCQFPCCAVGVNRLLIKSSLPVAFAVCISLPFPTIVWAKNFHLRPKMFFNWGCALKTGMVSVNKLNRLALDMTALAFISCCKWRIFAATTLTFAIRILQAIFLYPGRVFAFFVHRCRFGFVPNSVPRDKTNGFAFCLTAFESVSCSDASFFPAPTLALAIGREQSVLSNPRRVISYVFGKVWGIIPHSIVSLLDLLKPWDASNVAGATLLCCIPILAQMNYFGNHPVEEGWCAQ